MIEFEKYELMRAQGTDAHGAYLLAKNDGLDQIVSIRMLRAVYGLTLDDAKKVCFKVDTGTEYDDENRKLVNEFTQILDDELGLD